MKEITKLKKGKLKEIITKRLKEFEKEGRKRSWFNELCFCILTANSKAKTAIIIQKKLTEKGFSTLSQKKLSEFIKNNKHRFHNNKAKYIVEARKHKDIKKKIKHLSEQEAREWIVKNIKGIGYKEASHFLRNIGYKNIAILDRHILNWMDNKKIISKPKVLTKKEYLNIEEKFIILSKEHKMRPAELDLYIWFIKTGEVLK